MNPAQERSPEERARGKRVHAAAMLVMGVFTVACALAAGFVAFSAPRAIPAALYPWRLARPLAPWVRSFLRVFGR